MATLILIQKRKECARRRELFEKKREQRKFVKDVLSSWDSSKSGDLSYEEVSKWLSSIAQGQPATEDEIKWVIVMANQKRANDFESASIAPAEFSRAIEAWMSYRECKREIDEIFQKYDTDSSGGLDRTQLTNLLGELNDGAQPTEEEVEWVLKHADVIGNGVITKPELAKAVSVWYVHVAEQEESQRAEQVNSSKFCSAGPCTVQ
mmetsp:Transcript_7326/g.14551  ORF Transcript_7326/g.14551 Transcript_7326/m.14551 type:complete len:206 (+) Transcript_7326:182-799(+)